MRPSSRSKRKTKSEPFGRALPFSERRVVLMLGDSVLVACAALASLVTWWTVDGKLTWQLFFLGHWFWLPVFISTWLVLGWTLDLYDIIVASSRRAITHRAAGVVATIVSGYMLIYFFAPIQTLPRLFVFYFGIFAALLVIPWRWTLARTLTLPRFRQRVIILGTGAAGRALAEAVNRQQDPIWDIVGFVNGKEPTPDSESTETHPTLGSSRDLLHLARQHQANRIVIAASGEELAGSLSDLVECRAHGLCILQMPELYEQMTRQLPVEHIDMGWVLSAMDDLGIGARLEQIVRRAMDITLALLGIVVLLLVLPPISLAITLEDGGPVFYGQTRSGRASRPFRIRKLRTMRRDAELDGRPRWASENDERITRVGHFLRKTRLDELPQVTNVLCGEMSIVGPRPERPELIRELEQQVPYYPTRLMVRPGLTGWAQIQYDYGNSVADALVKLQYDLYYIRHRSIWLDLYIILKTIGVVLRMQGT